MITIGPSSLCPEQRSRPDRLSERHAQIVRLAGSLLAAVDWTQLLLSVTQAFPDAEDVRARIWALRPNNVSEVAAFPRGLSFTAPSLQTLAAAAAACEVVRSEDGTLFVPLRSVGVVPMLLELQGLKDAHVDFVDEAARVIASRAAYLALTDASGVVSPALRGTEEVARAICGFSAALQPLLAHDRMTIYLLTAGGRAIERFAITGASSLFGEGAITPISEFRLRECVLNNEAKLFTDIVRELAPESREARALSFAGFRSALNVPLRLNRQCVGILQLLSRSTGFYAEHDIQIAQVVADQSAPFIDHLRRQESVRPAALREAIETERTRLSCEVGTLADTTLTAAHHVLAKLYESVDTSDREILRPLQDQICKAQHEVDALLADITPPSLRSRSFERVIRDVAQKAATDYGLHTEVLLSGDLANASMTARRMTITVLSAALTAAHAAKSTTATVSLSVEDDVLLNVTDDGDPSERHTDIEVAEPRAQQTIAESVHALSGRIYTERDIKRGNTLVLELPLVQPVRSDLEDERWRAPVPESTPTRVLRVYVLDQQGVRRAGFSRFLDAQQALRVIGQAASIEDARRSIGWLQPDAVFVDAEGAGAAETIRDVRKQSPNSVVIGLASRTSHVSFDELRAAGAAGVLPQDLERLELLRAITQLVGGQEVALSFAGVDTAVPISSALNSREWAILKLIVKGCTNAEIGAELFLAPKTIERYVATIIHKVGARNRAHLVGVAIGRGLASSPTD